MAVEVADLVALLRIDSAPFDAGNLSVAGKVKRIDFVQKQSVAQQARYCRKVRRDRAGIARIGKPAIGQKIALIRTRQRAAVGAKLHGGAGCADGIQHEFAPEWQDFDRHLAFAERGAPFRTVGNRHHSS